MALNNQPLIFNLDKTFNLFNLNAKQYDTNDSRSFTFNIIQNNQPFNLTGFNIKIGGVKSDRKNFFNDVNIVDVNNGIIELDLTAQMLTTAGEVKLEFLFFKDNVRLSSYPFEINVIPSVTDFEAIQSSDEFESLQKALSDVSNFELKATSSNAPISHDCNDFITPELSFWWDTGIDGFKNTPLGLLPKNSARVFHVKNEGTEGRLIQTFNIVYPQYTNRTWTRCYNSDINAGWSEWSTVFMGERLISNGDDWNSFMNMGAYKVQGVDNAKNYPITPNGGTYAYGILNVFNSAIKEENRTLQVYYPHQADTNGHRIVYYRMYNGTEWTAWDTLGGNVYKKDVPFINNHKDVVVTEGNTSWASEDIKHLLDLWGASYNQGGNITFSALGDDKVNMAIDGDFYGLEGQVGVCKSINGLKDSCYKLSQEADANTNQIKSHNDTLYDLQHNWFSDCSNNLCINGFTSLKVYPQGVYYITGSAISELSEIDHSALKNGQMIYFIAETCDQTAAIKFCQGALANCQVYTPKGKDFWITGRDNGDTIYIMQKIGGALRFRSL